MQEHSLYSYLCRQDNEILEMVLEQYLKQNKEKMKNKEIQMIMEILEKRASNDDNETHRKVGTMTNIPLGEGDVMK